MIRRAFIWGEDEEYGGMGWIPIENRDFNASRGFGVAHDTIEHFRVLDRRPRAVVANELMAFGSMVYGRVMGGYWGAFKPSYHSAENIVGRDLGEFVAASLTGQGRSENFQTEIIQPPNMRRLNLNMEDYLEQIRGIAIESAWDDIKQQADGYLPDIERFTDALVKERLEMAMQWLRIGYRKAQFRFFNAESYDIAALFHRVEVEVDGYKSNEQGDILTVEIDRKRLVPRVWKTEIYEQKEYRTADEEEYA